MTAPLIRSQSRLQRWKLTWLAHVAYALSTLLRCKGLMPTDALSPTLCECKPILVSVATQTICDPGQDALPVRQIDPSDSDIPMSDDKVAPFEAASIAIGSTMECDFASSCYDERLNDS
eukprot:TRINITY_DN38933_c0_g1_i1.p1 TRINITY_DN38933_c0_g1~~TRINITY_DN38933_c0_g1_i1.p1  ORF type:complete len:135 (+),score=14.50 TRINITY_DN38933_c0_g1_i1:51-407(+)